MSVAEVAQSLVDLCKSGKFIDAYKTLFADDAKSIEGNGDTVVGMEALLAKSEAFNNENEIGPGTVTGPYVGVDSFGVVFKFQITPKATGKTVEFEEIALYTVKDGKITQEQFLYGVQ